MKEEIKVSIIVSTYNWPEALELCLCSLFRQTIQPMEIIIADDGSKEDTASLIHKLAQETSIPIVHIWHEDNGFRLAEIRNKAIQRVRSPYLIQLDGDVVVEKHFIADHLRVAEPGCFIRGTRTCLLPKETQRLLTLKKLSFMNRLIIFFRQPVNSQRVHQSLASFFTKKEDKGNRVKGCNMAFWTQDLVTVNGYNNSLSGWGHEDEELCWRLINLGRLKKIVKFSAVAFHLYHPVASAHNEPHHREVLQSVITEKQTVAANGLKEI